VDAIDPLVRLGGHFLFFLRLLLFLPLAGLAVEFRIPHPWVFCTVLSG
jgi:hypothetical protein